MKTALFCIVALLVFGCSSQPQDSSPANADAAESGHYVDYAMQQANNSTAPVPPAEMQNDSRLVVDYFYSEECGACRQIAPVVDAIESRHNLTARFARHSVLTTEGFLLFGNFTEKYNVSRLVPVAFVGNVSLVGIFEINSSLESLIMNSSRRG